MYSKVSQKRTKLSFVRHDICIIFFFFFFLPVIKATKVAIVAFAVSFWEFLND